MTHLGVCASIDPSKVNRVLVSNFVTASQAQRKFLNKVRPAFDSSSGSCRVTFGKVKFADNGNAAQVFAKVLKGSYTLGADSANIVRLSLAVSRRSPAHLAPRTDRAGPPHGRAAGGEDGRLRCAYLTASRSSRSTLTKSSPQRLGIRLMYKGMSSNMEGARSASVLSARAVQN